jgi:ribosomal protein S27E
MPADDRVKCVGCGRGVVPQLMIDDGNMLYQPRVLHLCPFCGAVINESGGRVNRLVLASLIFVGLFCLAGFVWVVTR